MAVRASIPELSYAAEGRQSNSPAQKTGELDVLVMSSSLLTDRMFLYTQFMDALGKEARVKVWATSAGNPRFRDVWRASSAVVEEFPPVRPFKEFPYNYLRRMNEFVWDYHQRDPSRMSIMRHVRSKDYNPYIRALRVPAQALALVRAGRSLENQLENLMLGYPRTPEALERLRSNAPDLLFTTGPFQFEQPAVAAAAKNLGIPTLALIPSWDNLTTKNRMVFKYDGYVVWSEQTRKELHHFYPYTRQAPTYVVGAPQFDVFFQEQFHQTREAFCATQGLRPDLPVIVYAVGSPNLLREHHGAVYLAERVARGDLGDVQMIVRPHPIHDNAEMSDLFGRFAPRVRLQQTAEPGMAVTARSQDAHHITEWVNTFRYADVVVNLSSTVSVDAAIFDRPVVNLDYDPEPGQPNQALVKDINHLWTHFKPIAESGGLWLVNDGEEMVAAVKTYLRHPEMHREKRRWVAEYVCGYIDGRCGDRMAQAILDFGRQQRKKRTRL